MVQGTVVAALQTLWIHDIDRVVMVHVAEGGHPAGGLRLLGM